ncbi:uncharacterized protein LOC115224499 isoform X2 [Octopus sinensis]|uniref:Uncharacterized protein LOC115224499 isoform X2 n=1 Tax=Octopus sinensis TaxID=2607531 RepID=A0A7E6FQF9_9MOLL|nr:uncharacterized protein LOC115224499 isoform X2 [Octopus sinensis]
MAGNVSQSPTAGSLVKEKIFRTGSFNDETICSSPIPLATSTAKKEVTTQSCTSATKSSPHSESSTKTQNTTTTTNATFKHPGSFIPRKTGKKLGKTSLGNVSKEVGKTSLGNVSQKEKTDDKSATIIPNFPAVEPYNISAYSENSILSNASSLGLIPDEFLQSGMESLLNPLNQTNVDSAKETANLSRSSRLSDIELVRRHALGNVDTAQRKLSVAGNGRLDVTQAFLQMHMLSMGDSSKQPPVELKEEDLRMLDSEFELEDPEEAQPILNLIEDNLREISMVSLKGSASAKLPRVDLGKPKTDFLSATPRIDNSLEEMSYCSTIGRPSAFADSFCLEKVLSQMTDNVPIGGAGQTQQNSEAVGQDKWGHQMNSTLMSSAENPEPLNVETFLDEPFETDLAYRADFDNYVGNMKGSGFGSASEDFAFDSGTSKLDADEAEFNGRNDCSNYDKCLEVPLATDLTDWSYCSHLSFVNQGEKDRMSVGTYMRIGSETLPNSFLYNQSLSTATSPALENLADVGTRTSSVQLQDIQHPMHMSVKKNKDLEAANPEQNPTVSFCEQLQIPDEKQEDLTLVSQSLVSNSLISDMLDGVSLSLPCKEIASRFESEVNHRCRSRGSVQKKESSHQVDAKYCKTATSQSDTSPRVTGGLELHNPTQQLHINATQGLNPSQKALHSFSDEAPFTELSVSLSSADTLRDPSLLEPSSLRTQNGSLSSAPISGRTQKAPLSLTPSLRDAQKVTSLSAPTSTYPRKVLFSSAPSSIDTQKIPLSLAPRSIDPLKVPSVSAPTSILHTASSMSSSTPSLTLTAPTAPRDLRTKLSSETPVNISRGVFSPGTSITHSMQTVPSRVPAPSFIQSRSSPSAVSTHSIQTIPSSGVFNLDMMGGVPSRERPALSATSVSTTSAASKLQRTVHSAPAVSSKNPEYASSPLSDSHRPQVSSDLQHQDEFVRPHLVHSLDSLRAKALATNENVYVPQSRLSMRSGIGTGEDNLQRQLSFKSETNLTSSTKIKPEATKISMAGVGPYCENKKFSDDTMHPSRKLEGPPNEGCSVQHANKTKQNFIGEGTDESKLWKTIIEEPLEQTQLNPFMSMLTASEPLPKDQLGHTGNCSSVLADPNLAACKSVLDVSSLAKFSDCCIGIAEKSSIAIRNLSNHWVECNVELIHILVNGLEMSTTDYCPFLLKSKLALGPSEVKEYEVIFFPQEPGSYIAKVKVESFTQTASSKHKNETAVPLAHFVKLVAVADSPRLHIEPKSLEFGKQSWGTSKSLPVRLANKSNAKLPLRLVISSQGVFRWDHYSVEENVREECNYAVSNKTICSLALPGSQAGCMLNMLSLQVFCDLAKNSALKDNTKSASLVGLVEIQLDVPNSLPPLAVIHLSVIAGIYNLQIINGVDLIKMETSLMKPHTHKVTLLNSGTFDFNVMLYINNSENVFSLDSNQKSISVGQVASVDVTFHPIDESVQFYNMELVIYLLPSGPAYGVPIQGEVVTSSQLKPKIVSNASDLNFGGVALGNKKEISLNLKNGSNVTARLKLYINSDLNSFKFCVMKSHTLLSESKSIVIPPNEIYPITVVFSPTQPCYVHGKINIYVSSGNSCKLIIPLFGYGAKSDIRLVEPCSGILELEQATAPFVQKTFTIQNVGFRDGFFCVKVFHDAEEKTLVETENISVKPENGILKPNGKQDVTLTCDQAALSSLPLYVSIYHGDEVARQQMKRIVTKLGSSKQNSKYCVWFNTSFADEDKGAVIKDYLNHCGESSLSVFFGHLSTINFTVQLSTYSNDVITNKWNHSRHYLQSPVSENNEQNTILLSPSIMDDVGKTSSVSGYSSYLHDKSLTSDVTLNANPVTSDVAPGDILSVSSYTSTMLQTPTNEKTSSPRKKWDLQPSQLVLHCNDPQPFYIINFSGTSKRFQLRWPLDKLNVSKNQVDVGPHKVETVHVSCTEAPGVEGIYIYVTTADEVLRLHVLPNPVVPKTSPGRPPLQALTLNVPDDRANLGSTKLSSKHSVITKSYSSTNLTSKNPATSKPVTSAKLSADHPATSKSVSTTKLSAERPIISKSVSSTKLSAGSATSKSVSLTRLSSECLLTAKSSSSSTKLHVESTVSSSSMTSTNLSAEYPKTLNSHGSAFQKDKVTLHRSGIEVGTGLHPYSCDVAKMSPQLNVSLTENNIAFHLEESSKLACNYLEITNNGQQTVQWSLDNQMEFPCFSNNEGKTTVMRSYDMFKIFELSGLLFSGQTYQVPIIFYPQVFLDCTFVCHQNCLLKFTSTSDDTCLTHPFTLQAFLDNDVLNPKIASSTAEMFMPSLNNTNSSLEVKSNVMAFYPCHLGETLKTKVIIKNRSQQSIKVAISDEDSDSPFSANVKSFTINSKKLVKLPVYFTPTCQGFVQRRMVFSSGTESLALLLFGVGVGTLSMSTTTAITTTTA